MTTLWWITWPWQTSTLTMPMWRNFAKYGNVRVRRIPRCIVRIVTCDIYRWSHLLRVFTCQGWVTVATTPPTPASQTWTQRSGLASRCSTKTFCRVGSETRKLINCDIIVAYISSCSYSYLTGHPQLLSCPDSPHSSFVILRSLAHFTITSSLSFNVCCSSSKLSVPFHATWKYEKN